MKIVNFNNSHMTSFKGSDPSVDVTQKYKQEYINFLASYQPNTRFANVSRNVSKAMIIVPFVDTAASFLIKKGALATKLKSSAVAASIWSAAFVASGLVQSGAKSLTNIKFFDDFNQKHPTASAVAKFTAMYGVFAGILKNVPRLGSFIAAKYPEKIVALSKKVFNPLKNALNNSLFNNKIVKPLNALADKNPIITKNLRTSAKLVAPIILLASVVRFVNEAKVRNENISNNLAILHALDELNNDTKV